MSHPSPWQLDLHALGEDVPAVTRHLPCASCAALLALRAHDPGPPSQTLLRRAQPSSTPSWRLWQVWAGAGAMLVLGAVLLWLQGQAGTAPTPPSEPDHVEADAPDPAPTEGVEPAPVEERRPPLHSPYRVLSAAEQERGPHSLMASHDGKKVAYIQPGGRLAVMNTDTLEVAQGPDDLVVIGPPRWHPEGILVYPAADADGRRQIYYSDRPYSPAQLRDDVPESWDPVISQTPACLVFVANQGRVDLMITDTVTGALRRLTSDIAVEARPAVDADCKTVVYSSSRGGPSQIYLSDTTTGNPVAVSDPAHDAQRPVFLGPDRVVYFAIQPNGADLRVIDLTTGNDELLVDSVVLPYLAPPSVCPGASCVAVIDAVEGVALVRPGHPTLVVPDTVGASEVTLFTRNKRPSVAFTVKDADGAWQVRTHPITPP